MYEQVEKTKDNKNRALSNSVAQKKSNVKQGFGFVDNRPEAVAQRKILAMGKRAVTQRSSISSSGDRGKNGVNARTDRMIHLTKPLIQCFATTNESVEQMPAKAIVAFQHAKAWLTIAVEDIADIADYSGAYFHSDDLQHLEDDYKLILDQWEIMNTAGEITPGQIEDFNAKIDVNGLRYQNKDSCTTLADTLGKGANALITIYPYGLNKSHDEIIMTYIHELSHASSLGTGDIAYAGSRMFDSIPYFSGLGRKNADSYAMLAGVFMNRKPSELGQEPNNGDNDNFEGFTQDEVRFLKATFGLSLAISTIALKQLIPAIANLKTAIERSSWDDDELIYWSIADNFPDNFPQSYADNDFDDDAAKTALATLNQLQVFLEEHVTDILSNSMNVSKDLNADYAYKMVNDHIGPRFFTDPEPDTFLLDLAEYEVGSKAHHSLMIKVAKFLANEEQAEVPKVVPTE